MAVLSQAVEAFSVGMALPSEQVFVHARRLREADETLIPRDPVGRNKGSLLSPPHILNLMVSVASSDPIAQAPRLVREWRAAGLVVPTEAVFRRNATGQYAVPAEHISRMAGRTLSGDMEYVIDRWAKDPQFRQRLDQDFWLTLTVGVASVATVSRTDQRLTMEYDARGAEEPLERQLFRVPGREREIPIDPVHRFARLSSRHFDIAAELWADSMAHGAVWQPTGSPSGGPEYETAVP